MFNNNCVREILKIRWSDQIPLRELKERSKQPEIIKCIQKRRLQWYGHIERMQGERLSQKMFYWTPSETTRKRGRKVKRWIDVIEEDANELKMSTVYMKQLTGNRTEWRRCVNALCK